MKSIWTESAKRPEFKHLEGDAATDVLIIGGGIAGILCAYKLRESGVDCMLVEADQICGGVTQNTTAKITLQHGLIYHKMISRFGREMACRYLHAQKMAMEQYKALCSTIPCDYEEKDNYVYSLDDPRIIQQEAAALNSIGCPADVVTNLPLPISVAGAVRVAGQAQFHPLKFIYTLAKDLPIYQHTKVLELSPREVITNHGVIRPKKIIVATHFPLLNKHGFYFLKLYQHRSYVIALGKGPQVEGMYVDENHKGMSFRNYGDRLLLGGGGHRTGKQGGGWQELESFAMRNYPEAEILGRWATQDCMTLDSIPYIGRYSASTPDLFVTAGFNKWGMTSSMVAAMLLTDLVQDKPNDYADVFSPSRSILRPQLAVNAAESLIGLLTPTTPRCPHLGCALKYNPQEHSWDCGCHGSRFTETGELIDNPATDDKSGMPQPPK